jgi:hypothetical protein
VCSRASEEIARRCSWSQKYEARDSAKCRVALYFCSARQNRASAGGVYNVHGKKAVIIALRYFSATAEDALTILRYLRDQSIYIVMVS